MSIDIIFPYEHHLHCPGLPVALPEQATEVAYIYATYQKKTYKLQTWSSPRQYPTTSWQTHS